MMENEGSLEKGALSFFYIDVLIFFFFFFFLLIDSQLPSPTSVVKSECIHLP